MSSTSETPQETPQVRDMRAEEVETLWRWTAEGLWNQSLRDVRVYYKCHPEGWRAVDVDGELAGKCGGTTDQCPMDIILPMEGRPGLEATDYFVVLSHIEHY